MVSKNNVQVKDRYTTKQVPHYGIRKLSVGVASVLLGTTFYMGMNGNVVHADTVNGQDRETPDSQVANSDSNSGSTANSDANVDKIAIGDKQAVGPSAEAVVNNEVNTKPQVTEITNDSHVQSATNAVKSDVDANAQSDAANVKSDIKTPSNEMTSAVSTEASPAPMSPSASSSSQGVVTAPVESEVSSKANSQAQPSSVTNIPQIKLSYRPVMRLAAATTTNSDELIVGKDVTISDFSVTAAEGKNEFENAHANIKFIMHADDPSALVGKRLTIQLSDMWTGFGASKNQGSNSATISYQGQVIGTFDYGYPAKFAYIMFNDHVKNYAKITVQSDLVIAGYSWGTFPYSTYVYTPTKAKDGQIYHLTNDVTIGQQKYSSNLPSVIHYRALASDSISSAVDVTTSSYTQRDSELLAGTFYKTPNGIYYSRSSYYSGSNLYDKEDGQPGYLEGPDLYVGTDIITDHTQSYTATIDIDQTKLSPDSWSIYKPIASYYLSKDYWDDEYLLPNTSDVYRDYSNTLSSTATANATVTKNVITFNKLNGQSLSTRRFDIDIPTSHMSFDRYTNYISQSGKLHFTPALFKQLQAAAESDQNLTEAINTVKTTGMGTTIKLVNPINTGLKATIKTSDGKTKEVSLLIDTIDYQITTASTAPKGAILVAAQGKTAKVYHPGDQNIPSVVDQSQLTKTITRTINVHKPGEKAITIKQVVVMTQSVSVVDGKDVTYNGDWKVQGDSYWASYDTPVVPGYAANYSRIAGQPVSDETGDQTIEITYTANSQTTHVNYVDTQGTLIHTTTVNGHTNQTVDVPSEVPAGWKLVDGQTVPNTITFGPNGHADTSVKIEHRHVTVTPDRPQSNGTKLPDNPKQSFHGVEASDLNKTVTRTIKVTTPDGQTKTVTQTVKLTRTATVDEVTGNVTYSDWSTGQWAKYDVPAVNGYTSTQTEVAAVSVNEHTTDQTVNVTYTPNAQKLSVKFIDDTTGQVLKTVAKTGVTNANAGYSTKSDIQNYEGQHYVLVSDSSNGASLVFDNNDSVDQAYEVHLKHGTHQINEHHTITQTVHYTATDHASVPADHTASVQFDRDGYHDEVMGVDHWNSWKQGGTQTFTEVPTPKKAGYTPDKSSVPVTVVYSSDHNQTITVTYTPDTQKVIVTFIDDTNNGKTLKTVTKTGPTNSSAGYTTGDDINTYKGQHYVLVSDQTHGQSITFDTDTNTDQHYEVHLKHGTHQINDHRAITETVHYKMTDGTTAPADHTAKIEFSRDGFNDEVTGDDHWNAWTPGATHQFDAVQSPAVKGYTPDVDQIPAVTVNPDSQSIDRTVTYSPNVQIDHVKYIDDTDHKVLTQDDLTGRTGEISGYHTADRITEFKGQYYDLVSDNYPTDGMTFDNNDHADQIYEVHFKHATRTDEQDVQVPRTIKYVYQDGRPAQPDHTDVLSFHETKVVDLVDGHTVSDDWTPSQDFATIKTPSIQGYTPDHASVSNAGIAHDHAVIVETVTYNPDAQKAVVKYIDDTTGEQLEAKDLTGVSDQSAGYNTKETIDGYVARHYNLVSDGTHGETIVFDHDDDADQAYEVHFKHATAPVTDHRVKDLTVHYVYTNGQARTGKAADDQTAPELTFNRTGVRDLVTNNIAWNAWDHVDQTFSAVKSPAIQGYTPDRAVVDNVKVNPDANASTEVTVVYNADAQKLTVNFIDDVTGQTLKIVTKTGYSDGDAGYNTKADIQIFAGQHYDLVSDVTKGAELIFDHDDSVDQAYDVHLTHHLTPISDHQVVNETIHYVYADGLARTGKAADDYTATSLEFNRTGNHDDVTGTDAWNAWIPGSASFAAVQSPVIQGYTPDQSQVDVITVDANSQDIVKTVTYSADQQTVTVDFIDDTDGGRVLKTVTKTGGSDEAVGYNTNADIQTFVDGHYRLDRDTTNGKDLVFDHDDATDQHYEVHLTHETAPISEATSTNQVIHYQLADGTPVAKDYTAKVDFSRDGFKDLVTNADHWNAWTPNATQTFDAVVSPAKAGYTPDHSQVDAVTVEPHHADLETTVTYSPDAQKAAVKYIDDVIGKTLQTKELTGVSDETSTYTTESTIKQYVGQHYKLVSDQTNGKAVVFDHDDGSNQTFEVHLTHTYQSVSQEHQVHQTIHYQYVDGKQARPDYSAKALAFSRTGTQDLVTEKIQWNAWTPDQVFAAVDTPAVSGYTPDVQTVAPVKVSHDSKDVEQTVVYHADDQTILVNYIDDETQSTLKTDSIIGKTAQTSDYTTKKSLDQYEGQHYDVVSDDTNGDSLTFDSDSTKVQIYNVHLKHQHQAASDKATVHQTVHYVYQDGKQAAKDHTATPIEFTRTGDTDLVTGKTTWNAWTPATGTFVAVLSPVITGYTPSRSMINHVDVHPGDKDFDTTVTYVPDRQVIVVNYIDQTTGKTLKTDTLTGHSDQNSGYTTKTQIDSYLGQHYKLVSDATNGQVLTFDHDDQATQTYDVVLGHQTESAHRTHEVHETVDYVYADGSQADKSFAAQPLVFSQTGVHDLVTNTTDWNGEWTQPQVFAAVESPKITGFTASKPEVKAVKVNHQSSDVHELVIYAANAQTAQIKYIDDVTGNVLETDGANGHFNESIVFSHNVNDQISKFKQAHYKLVSNNFVGQKYQADDTKNVYEVHLTHERQNVHATDTVTETVKFQYADGSQAQPTKIQAVNFGRDGIKDLVTGATAWMPVDPQTIGAVDVPVINGYTADTDQILAVKVNFGDDDITKVVIYIANDQNAGIKIIDDTTGKVLNTQVANGKFGTEIQFKQDPDQQVIDLQSQHYELVSDNFKHQKYQSDNAKNQFEIHVKHQMMDVQRTDKVTETIHYLGPDGNKLAPDKTQTITFTQHGVKDQVTGQIDWNSVEPQEFNAVKSPVINGYQVDIAVVEGRQVLFGDQDVVVNVHYTKLPEQQPGKVTPEKVVTAANGMVQETKQDTIKNSAQSTMQDTNQLPQTGNDNRAGLLSLIGSSLMASLAVFGLGKKKKHEN